MSENIEVVSVVGRYLEHARIVYFRNGGNEELFLSSADWMPRNLDKRIELLFPVLDAPVRKRIAGIIEAYFKDERKARRLEADGTWMRRKKAKAGAFSAQDSFHEAALKRRKSDDRAPTGELVIRRLPRQGGPGENT